MEFGIDKKELTPTLISTLHSRVSHVLTFWGLEHDMSHVLTLCGLDYHIFSMLTF